MRLPFVPASPSSARAACSASSTTIESGKSSHRPCQCRVPGDDRPRNVDHASSTRPPRQPPGAGRIQYCHQRPRTPATGPGVSSSLARLEVLHAKYADFREGEVATSIPKLFVVDPERFGSCTATARNCGRSARKCGSSSRSGSDCRRPPDQSFIDSPPERVLRAR